MGFLFVLKRIGYFALDNWRVVLPVAVFAVVLLWVAIHFGCQKPAPKLDQKEILDAQTAIAANDRKTQIEILANSDVRTQQIDANVAAGRNATVNAIADAKEKYAAMTNDELAQELESRSHE